MLTRIYGTAFLSKEALAEHLERLELARARDHRRLGRQLGLFHFSELSPGTRLLDAARHDAVEHAARRRRRDGARTRLHGGQDAAALRRGAVADLRALGQLPASNMFITTDDERPMGLKPMNCPGHCVALRDGAPLLPRPAGALLRARPAAPQGALRHAPRPAARAPVRPGRRAHLLHRGADPRRGRRAAWTSASRSTGCSTSTCASSSRRAPRSASATTRSGTTPRTR